MICVSSRSRVRRTSRPRCAASKRARATPTASTPASTARADRASGCALPPRVERIVHSLLSRQVRAEQEADLGTPRADDGPVPLKHRRRALHGGDLRELEVLDVLAEPSLVAEHHPLSRHDQRPARDARLPLRVPVRGCQHLLARAQMRFAEVFNVLALGHEVPLHPRYGRCARGLSVASSVRVHELPPLARARAIETPAPARLTPLALHVEIAGGRALATTRRLVLDLVAADPASRSVRLLGEKLAPGKN